MINCNINNKNKTNSQINKTNSSKFYNKIYLLKNQLKDLISYNNNNYNQVIILLLIKPLCKVQGEGSQD
jgi:hypothetical protein